MTRAFRQFVAPALVLVAAACSSAQPERSSLGAGVQRSFDAPYEKVRDAARTALIMMKLEPSSQREDAKGLVIGFSQRPTFGGWGSNAGRVTIVRSGSQPITVHALYERNGGAFFTNSDGFGRRLFVRMEAILSGYNVPAPPSENAPSSETPS